MEFFKLPTNRVVELGSQVGSETERRATAGPAFVRQPCGLPQLRLALAMQ